MWHRIKDLWAHNRSLLIAFLTVAVLSGYFGTRAVHQFIYWSDPAKQDQDLAGWMTPRYVGQSYQVPPDVVKSALQMDMDAPPRRISLDRLAAENGMSMQDMQSALEAAVAAWRAENPRPAR